jgi:hypothetical protein
MAYFLSCFRGRAGLREARKNMGKRREFKILFPIEQKADFVPAETGLKQWYETFGRLVGV